MKGGFFQLREHGTDPRTEALAGATTFVTMAYILFVNPLILSSAGMDRGAVFTATALASAAGTLVMGLFANVPFAVAPGMGLNAFFAFTVVAGLGLSWREALGLVFLCGLINIAVTVTRLRKMLVEAVPESLQCAISAGIGLFIAYIGMKNARFLDFLVDGGQVLQSRIAEGKVLALTASDAVPQLSAFADPTAQLSLAGLLIIMALLLLRVRGAVLFGILLTTALGLLNGVTRLPRFAPQDFVPPSLAPTFLQFDLRGLWQRLGELLPVVLAFSLTDTFDTVGTFLGTGRKTGIFDARDEASLHRGAGFSSKLDRALFADSIATSLGALLGTSNVTTYVESAAGIAAGGRTGLASLTTAGLFLLALFLAPLALMIPAAATAPALIAVGVLMMEPAGKIRWGDLEEAVPAFFTAAFMPFTYSISNGIAAGFVFHILAKLLRGKAREVHPILYVVTGLFLLNYLLAALR
ncbi:MAG: NCS2 family permease [Elusimicrobia bacterium]|nr:NCS2 family permease [Elusimicrobiota bacterium]